MKLILQIAIGVFLGMFAAQVTIELWRGQQTEKQHLEREKARLEQAERIRKLFLESRKPQESGKTKAPAGFIPDDAQMESNEQN